MSMSSFASMVVAMSAAMSSISHAGNRLKLEPDAPARKASRNASTVAPSNSDPSMGSPCPSAHARLMST